MINDEWREDQGVQQDDEEALAIEIGEFCKPQVPVRAARPNTSKPKSSSPSSVATLVNKSVPSSSKRRSTSDAASSQDVKPKKKAKKAVAA